MKINRRLKASEKSSKNKESESSEDSDSSDSDSDSSSSILSDAEGVPEGHCKKCK